MASVYLQRSSYREPVSIRRRATSAALALGVVALLLLLLWKLGAPILLPPTEGRSLSTFDVTPEAKTPRPERAARRRAAAKPRAATAQAPPPPLPPAPLPPKAAPTMLSLSLADSDIGKMARAPGAETADTGEDSATPYGPGAGPGGARLYDARWYKEPPANALALYLPGGAPAGAWATVACRTVANFHVDDCRQLDDSPPGLGLSRAVRQAAWQFLVRPPRLGGKPLVGAWVRIRFDFTKKPGSE